MPIGWSTNKRLALLFQEWTLFTASPSLFNLRGPFSTKMASSEEQPGPPVSHKTKGSVSGLLLEGKNQ